MPETSIEKIEKSLFIKDRFIYCKVRIQTNNDALNRDPDQCFVCLAGRGGAPTYRVGCHKGHGNEPVIESNVHLYQLEKGKYRIGLQVGEETKCSGEHIDTLNLLELEKSHENFFISIHIPKTAGTTFGTLLENTLGDRFICHEYMRIARTDPLTPISPLPQSGIFANLSRTIRQRFSQPLKENQSFCLHGHVGVRDYKRRFPNLINKARYLAWFREPAERVISQYEFTKRDAKYILMNNPNAFVARKVVEENLSVEGFAELKNSRNLQKQFISPLKPTDFFFVGIKEEFDKSIRLFRAMMGIADDVGYENRKISKSKPKIDPELKKRIHEYNRQDLVLYEEAREYFNKLCGKYGIN